MGKAPSAAVTAVIPAGLVSLPGQPVQCPTTRLSLPRCCSGDEGLQSLVEAIPGSQPGEHHKPVLSRATKPGHFKKWFCWWEISCFCLVCGCSK